MAALDQMDSTLLGRLEDGAGDLAQSASIAVCTPGCRRAVPSQQTEVILKLLAGLGAREPRVELRPEQAAARRWEVLLQGSHC
jgi:hypothetical protein